MIEANLFVAHTPVAERMGLLRPDFGSVQTYVQEFRSSEPIFQILTVPRTSMDYYTILRTFGEGVDFPIFALNQAYRYIYFNPLHAQVMAALYGVEIEVGGALPTYQTPADWAIARRNVDRALAGEHVLETDYSGEGENRRYFRVSHQPLRDEAGVAVGVLVVAQDLTEQAQALDALQMSERRFRGLVEKSSDAIALLTADGTVLYDSPSAPGMLGYEPEDWIGESAFDLIHPDDVGPIQRMLGELSARPGDHANHLFRLQHKQGRWLWIEATATNLLQDPSVQAIVVNYRDVTERVETESRLRASEGRLREVWETTTDGMVLSDPDGTVLSANPAFLDLYGYTEDEIVGQSFVQIFPEEFRKVAANEYQRFFQGKAAATVAESEVQRKDGTRRVVESRATFLMAGAERIAMLSTIRDITERKVAEDQLRETNRQLEVALEELRRTQAQLVRQERLAAVGQLAAGIAHDFNNILSVILLQAQLALRTPEVTSSEVTPLGGIKPAATALRERLTTVAQQAGRAGDLVQQILDFSRSAVLQTRPLNVDDFFREQVELLRRTLDGQIRVRLEGEATNIIMNVDPTRLQQLFTNLALNARDAMPQGGELVITLDLLRDAAVVTQPGTEVVAVMDGRHESPERDAGSWLRIGVRDTGLGIPASKLPRIFEPFFTTKQPGQGTGLGLAQVYGIVKQHNGHIDVRSEEGAGTTFTIYLPVSSATEPHLQSRGAREWAGEMPHGKGQTILVVEEDLSLARALEDTLAALGYVPLVATDRAGAAHWIEQERESIALVISDLTTGDLAMNDLGSREPFSTSQPPPGQSTATLSPAHADGRSAFEAALHAQAAFFEELNVPVVVLTGPEPAQREQTLLAEGITGWLPKPPELERLAHLLARLLAEAPDR